MKKCSHYFYEKLFLDSSDTSYILFSWPHTLEKTIALKLLTEFFITIMFRRNLHLRETKNDSNKMKY